MARGLFDSPLMGGHEAVDVTTEEAPTTPSILDRRRPNSESRQADARGLLERTRLSQAVRADPTGYGIPPEEVEGVDPKDMSRHTILGFDNDAEAKFHNSLTQQMMAIRPQTAPPEDYNMNMSEVNPVTLGSADDESITGTDVVDFLFGGEMAILGVKHDTEGWSWNMDNFKQQWSEEPLWINALNAVSLVGTMAFPIGRALWALGKFGKGATLAKRLSGISKADEVGKYESLGMIEKGTKVDDKTLGLLRRQEHYRTHYMDLNDKLAKSAKGEGQFGFMDRVKLSFARRFANDYFKLATSVADGADDVRTAFHQRLDGLFASEDIGRFFINMPTAAAGKRIYQHWLQKQGVLKKPVKLSADERQWADGMEIAMRNHQKEALEEGLIDSDTISKVGEIHLPALYKDTPRPDLATGRQLYVPIRRKATQGERAAGIADASDEVVGLRPFEMPRLDSPTLKARQADLPEVARRLLDDELITDPSELTVRGFVMDRLLMNNYRAVRDIATDDRFAVSAHDVMTKFGGRKAAEKAGFVSLDGLQGGIPGRIRRMIEKKDSSFLGGGGELPWIRRAAFDDLFGTEGIFAQASSAFDMMSLLTSIHKTSKTALSVPTHFQNFTSNLAMLSQAGFNPLSPRNLGIQSRMAKAFEKIATANRANLDDGSKIAIDQLAVNLGKMDIDGKSFDLTKELMDPKVLQLVEASAFESVEGFQNIRRMAERLRPEQRATKMVADAFIGMKKKMQLNDKNGFRWFDQMTKWYLAEDMVPKMSYYMSLRAQGLTTDAAILEVGRRLPMYQSVGSAIKTGRRWAFPWATFPTEAARITKNNMMDHPLRMLPWLQMPSIVQATASMAGFAPGNTGAVSEAKRQLPMWAQRSETVMMEQGAGNVVGGAASGGLTGGIVGGRIGGAPGAIAGGLLGTVVGGGLANSLTDAEGSDRLRGSVLDWLPHTSFFLSSTSPEFGGTVNSFGHGLLPFKDLQGALEQAPAEPLAILKPFIDIMSGRTSWGQDIGAEDTGGQFGKALAGFIGFMAPPFMQKYGFKTTTPDVSFSQHALGTDLPGDITNVSRALIDSGSKLDPITGRPGNLTSDMLLKNFGLWKSWATDPANRLSNELGTEKHLQQIRSYATKNLAFHLENGHDTEVLKTLNTIMTTFSQQFVDNPARAQEKYNEWLQRHLSKIGRHPRLRQWSEDELRERLQHASDFARRERGKARDDMLKFLHQQLAQRTLGRVIAHEQKALDKERRGRGNFGLGSGTRMPRSNQNLLIERIGEVERN